MKRAGSKLQETPGFLALPKLSALARSPQTHCCLRSTAFIKFHNVLRTSLQKTSEGLS